MKTIALTAALLGGLGTVAWADVSKEELLKLARSGVGDEVIRAYVKSHGPVPSFSADDLAELKTAGLSDRILESLIASPAPPPGAPSTPPPAEGTAPPPSTPAPAPGATGVVESSGPFWPYSYPVVYPYPYPSFSSSFAISPVFGFNARFVPRTRFFVPSRSRFVFRR